MINNKNGNLKKELLKKQGAINPKPEAVKDELFKKFDFFDAHDLIQVKYEMVRRVEENKWPIAKASKTFGLSRPAFYEARNTLAKEGLPGLLPRQRGPKKPHKLSEQVIKFVQEAMAEDKTLRIARIASIIEKRFGFKVHRRSIERALEKSKKKPKSS